MNYEELTLKIARENPVHLYRAREIVKELILLNYNINAEHGVSIPIEKLSDEFTAYISNNIDYEYIIPSLIIKYKEGVK